MNDKEIGEALALIAEARYNVSRAASSATPTQARLILSGDAADDRLRLLVKLSDALESQVELRSADHIAFEYGTARSVVDGWERGDRFGDGYYIEPRSVSGRPDHDPSTVTGVRPTDSAVRRRKAGEWERFSANVSVTG